MKKKLTVVLLPVALNMGIAHAESLGDIYQLAVNNDAQLRAEEALYKADLETEKLALSALLPKVSASYSYSNTDLESRSTVLRETGTLTPTGIRTNRDTDRDGYSLSLSQAIFDVPSWFSFKSGQELSRQAAATFAANQQNLILRTVSAYFAVLRAKDNLQASRAQERALDRQLEQTRQRFDVGLIAITDVYEAQAAYDLSQVQRIEYENAVAVATEKLSVLTGDQHGELNVLVDNFPIKRPEPIKRADWVEFAIKNNYSLSAARYKEEAARANAMAKKSEHLPKVTGSYSYSDYDTDGSMSQYPAGATPLSPDGSDETQTWSINLSVPLFSGGATSANRRKAAQQFNAAREQRINLTRNTVSNTRSQHMTVMSNVSRVAARKQSIVSSKSALDATQAGYDVGTRNVVDVLNAQNALYSAQRDYANSRYDYIIAMMQLKLQAGQLSPEDIVRLDAYLKPAPSVKASEQAAGD